MRGARKVILPEKHLPLSRSYLNVGAVLLESIDGRRTVSQLWDATRGNPAIQTFDRLVLGLDMLYALGLVDMDGEGAVVRRRGRGA